MVGAYWTLHFLENNCASVGRTTSIRGRKKEQQKTVVEANATPAK
jgi:hypothetical protein